MMMKIKRNITQNVKLDYLILDLTINNSTISNSTDNYNNVVSDVGQNINKGAPLPGWGRVEMQEINLQISHDKNLIQNKSKNKQECKLGVSKGPLSHLFSFFIILSIVITIALLVISFQIRIDRKNKLKYELLNTRPSNGYYLIVD